MVVYLAAKTVEWLVVEKVDYLVALLELVLVVMWDCLMVELLVDLKGKR